MNMTERLYLSDSYLTTFNARIVERHHLPPDARLAIVLDRTIFSPSVAGVASDRGTLNDVQVTDVIEDKGRLLHVISQEIWRDDVQGRLDWPRRFDLMQHHVAQHILSEALMQVAGIETVGASITPQVAWIEVGRRLSEADIERAETWANQVIISGRAVRVATVDAARAASLPDLAPNQKIANDQPVRVFNIEGLRLSVCNAPHVSRTSEIGLLRISGVDRANDRLRIEFQCGTRILTDFNHYDRIVTRLTSLLGAPPSALEQAVITLKTRAGQAIDAITTVYDKMLEHESTSLALSAERVGDVQAISRVFPDRDMAEVRQLIRLLVERPGLVVLIGTSGAHAQLFCACSSDVNWDMNVLMKAAAQMLDTQGGGQQRWTESMPVRADTARVEAALSKAFKLLQSKRR